MSEKPDPSTPSTIEWISRAANTSTYVFLLHLRFSRECEKCEKGAREREKERDRWDTLSVFTIEPRRLPGDHCASPSSFPEHRLLGFLLSRPLSFYNEQLLSRLSSFRFVVIPSGRSRSARLTARREFLFARMHYLREKGEQRGVDEVIDAADRSRSRLASRKFSRIEFNIIRKNCVIHPLPFAIETAS